MIQQPVVQTVQPVIVKNTEKKRIILEDFRTIAQEVEDSRRLFLELVKPPKKG
jgi:hypothetical protein